MKLSEIGEFGLIGQIRSSFPAPEGVEGIGDDCAVIPQQAGMEMLVSTDMLMEGAHFLLEDVPAYKLGWKSAAVNFSDIAAMGGDPVGSFLAFALPKCLPDGWVEEFMRGYGDISRHYGFPLLGGDTTSSPDRLSICVTVLGQAPRGRSLRRSKAQVGDLVCVTGTLGDSAGGLDVVLNSRERDSDAEHLLARHYMPSPRMAEGQALASTEGVHAMMDVSDGIASDLRHIMEESGVGARVDVASLPVSDALIRFCGRYGLDIFRLATGGGEDYELLFTMSPDAKPGIDYTIIGEITDGIELVWNGSEHDYSGFRHF
ncbi:MAG: thiamine-phosphate kinase [Bacteroidales bacterium]|nr:thiamine-phosphate kinase [Bacteroidales bacterium]